MQITDAVEVVHRHIAKAREANEIPGVAFGLIKDGALVHAEGVGEAVRGSGETPRADTRFRIASMTKSFTAATTLLLRDRGLLRLDDEVAQHCPWAAGIGTPHGSHPLTVRDLLTMQAGFPTDDPWGDRQESWPLEDFDRLIGGGISFTRPPRTAFEYSNLGYALLGRVIAQVTGRDYREVVRTEMLAPLGMNATVFDVNEVPKAQLAQGYAPVASGLVEEPFTTSGAFSPMGGLFSTIDDLSVWVRGFLAAEADDASFAHPLSIASRREMQVPHLLIETFVSQPSGGGDLTVLTSSYGFGLLMQDHHPLGRFMSHSGGYPGFGSHMRWHAASGWGIAALGNRTYANMRLMATEALDEIVAGTTVTSVPTLWPETERAQNIAESLLRAWDDALLDSVAAMNIDLDRPRADRRADWQRISEQIGEFTRVAGAPESHSPAHARWWVEGTGGRARLEVLLDPELDRRVQALQVTTDPAPEVPAD